MDSLITAAARALATGDPLGALNRVALRNDPPALALRGIAMAQLGDLVRARALLQKAARAFEKSVASLPEIVACWSIAGSADFLLQVIARDLDTYAEFAMTTIRRLPGIKAMTTTFTLKEVKPPSPWPIPRPTVLGR